MFETALVESMLQVGVRLRVEDVRRLKRALDRVHSQVRTQSNEVPRQIAAGYQQRLIANITSGKFVPGYAKYHPSYQKWKLKHGRLGFPSYWRLFGDLVKAIGSYKVGAYEGIDHAWFAGVPAGVTDTGGKSWTGQGNKGTSKEIAWYGRIAEQGASGEQDHPARPVFEPTFDEHETEAGQKAEQGLLKVSEYWR